MDSPDPMHCDPAPPDSAAEPIGPEAPVDQRRSRLRPDRAYAVVDEQEPDGLGGLATTTTVFLTASECPIGCSMCDLWQNTLTSATAPGMIPQQIHQAGQGRATGGWLKLYNSGNFFDARSIPPSDYQAIAKACRPYSRVIVENHPKIGRERLRQFRAFLSSPLEIAVGLETVQPRWLARLSKRMSRDDFDAYAKWLRSQGVDLRVFLIFGVPGISLREASRWTRLSVRHAIAAGARHISLIPARAGNGWGGRADQLQRPSLQDLIELQELCLRDNDGCACITVDLWDAEQLASEIGEHGIDEKAEVQRLLDRLAERNLNQRADA